MHRLVIDTNVFVSSIIGKSFPHHVVNLVLARKVEILISTELLEEYSSVFNRPKFTKYPNFQAQAFSLINKLRRAGLVIQPNISLGILVDHDDNKFLDLAVTANADFLITGNTKHFPFGKFENTEIISPQKYWNNYWK